MPLPPWVQTSPRDYLHATEAGTQAGLRGAEINNQVKQAHQRIQQESAQASARMSQELTISKMREDVRKDILQQQMARQQEQMALMGAYHQAEVGLGEQRLDEVRHVQQAKAEDAAKKHAAMQGVANDLKNGVPMDQAAYRNSDAFTPGEMAGIIRTANNPSAQRITPEQKIQDENLKARLSEWYKKEASELDPDERKNIEKRIQEIEQKRMDNVRPGNTAGTGTQSSYKEGQLIRNKKDGKIYVFKNGEPVPQDQGQQAPDQQVPELQMPGQGLQPQFGTPQ